MKKLLLSLLAVAAAASPAAAQVEIGLKVSPSYTYLRADATTGGLTSESGKISFGGGVLFDLFFGENYAFSTGLFLTGKGGTVKYADPQSAMSGTQKIALQYIELPATVKLFTNDVATDVRLYFQVGGSIAVPIATRIDGEKTYTDALRSGNTTQASDHILLIDANAIAAFGAEYQLAKSTKALFGLSYHRGLIDVDRFFDKDRGYQDASIKNNVFALDLGLKF